MKNLSLFALIACASLFFVSCTKSCSSESQDKVLTIGTNANLPPFETIDKNGQLVGFDIDFGRALAKEMGLEAKFKEFDFDALILALNKGKIDVIISGMSITQSRQQQIAMVPYLGEPMTKVSFLFWGDMAGSIKNMADLKKLSAEKKLAVSVQSGHFLEDYLRDEGVEVKPLTGPPEQILDIKYRKSLAAAVDVINGESLAKNHSELKLVTLDLPEDKWDLGNGVGISKQRADLIEQVKSAIAALKEQGVIKNLEETWFKGGPQ